MGMKKTAAGGAVGLLVATEVGSGLVQGWYGPLLTDLGERYGASAAMLNLVAVAYLLSSVVFVPLLTKLGDKHGHKKLLLVAVAITAVGSLLVAFAPSFGVLLFGRVLQGALVAFLPLEFAIVRQRSPEKVDRSIGALIASLAIGAVVGAVGAGVLVSAAGLTAALVVPGIYFAVCFVLIAVFVPETETSGTGSIDWAGIGLLGVGVASVLGGISLGGQIGWANPVIWALVVVGIGVLAAFVVVEQRVAEPFIDFDVLLRGGIGLPIVIGLVFSSQSLGAASLSALYVRVDPEVHGFGLGLDAAQAGMTLSAMALAGFLGSLFGARFVGRWGYRPTMVVGSLSSGLGYLMMILVPGSVGLFTVWLVLGGIGIGVMTAVLPAIVVKRANPDAVAVVSGLYNTLRTAMGAAAGAAFTAVMAAFLVEGTGTGDTAGVTSFTGYAMVWGCAVVLSLVSVALILRLPKDAAPSTPAVDDAAETAEEPEPELV
ncbi:MFS transporter [Demequina mangrovi]|uniref:Predicted arabinose efflux permease, MFS family n=1 Tax=Demequina mangrovi TaxID=1043493 RepID=A0A1H6Y7G4_9MICO|nr:MFS transporter [Demequina mangrovi]SEJ37209.1 Predicted arabinose efflux permease, MFS family [Demequina mangrovi]